MNLELRIARGQPKLKSNPSTTHLEPYLTRPALWQVYGLRCRTCPVIKTGRVRFVNRCLYIQFKIQKEFMAEWDLNP